MKGNLKPSILKTEALAEPGCPPRFQPMKNTLLVGVAARYAPSASAHEAKIIRPDGRIAFRGTSTSSDQYAADHVVEKHYGEWQAGTLRHLKTDAEIDEVPGLRGFINRSRIVHDSYWAFVRF